MCYCAYMEQKIDRAKLLNYRAKHPNMTQTAIAHIFHISKQRINKIFKDEDLKAQSTTESAK